MPFYRLAHWGRTFLPKTPYFHAATLKRRYSVESTFEMDEAISVRERSVRYRDANRACR
jgi:hypothetical protein